MDVAVSLLLSADLAKENKTHLERKLVVATYEFQPSSASLRITYAKEQAEFNITLRLAHNEQHFFEQLHWVEYSMTSNDEVLRFDLGRNELGDPKNPSCDQFPPFVLHKQAPLEHYL